MTIIVPIVREGEVHLAYTRDYIQDHHLLDTYLSLLTSEERRRHDRFKFDRDRHRYLATRALIRWMLSYHTGVNPNEFDFRPNKWGKPEITKPEDLTLNFNVANTRGIVVCAIVRATNVGVDIEDTTRLENTFDIAQRFFAKAEIDDLRRLPEDLQRKRFFDYWTLKEAYVKGRGMGMSIPFNKFTIKLHDRAEPTVEVDPEFGDGLRWQLQVTSLTECHRLAFAVRLGDRPAFTCLRYPVAPFSAI